MAKYEGGAILLVNIVANIKNSNFSLNTANDGGCIKFKCNYLDETCNLTVSNSIFLSNTVTQ